MILIITVTGMVYNWQVYSQCSLSDIWTSLISVDRLDLQVAIVYMLGFIVKLFVLVRKVP